MKFAKHMSSKAVPSWNLFYLDYKKLKKLLEPLTRYAEFLETSTSDSVIILKDNIPKTELEEAEHQFQEGFKEEVDKVEFFTYSKLKQCKSLFQQLSLQFFELKYPSTHLENNNKHLSDTRGLHQHTSTGFSRTNSLTVQSNNIPLDSSEKLSSSLHGLIVVLKHLSNNFIPLNKLAVYKIFKKHDKQVSKIQKCQPDAFNESQLALAQELLKTAKTERRFYYRYKDDIIALMEEAQHMQHEINRLSIRKRQEGVV